MSATYVYQDVNGYRIAVGEKLSLRPLSLGFAAYTLEVGQNCQVAKDKLRNYRILMFCSS